MHIFHPQDDLVEACKRHNIRITSYGTLGSPGSFEFRNKTSGDCLRHPLVLELAEKYKKTPAQVLLLGILFNQAKSFKLSFGELSFMH